MSNIQSPLVPLSIGLIDEGRFLTEIDQSLFALQGTLIDYTKEHGDISKKAKAVLIVKISLVVEEPKSLAVSVRGEHSVTLPKPPASITMGIAAESEQGPCLFVRRSGSTKDSPHQHVFTTADGQRIKE